MEKGTQVTQSDLVTPVKLRTVHCRADVSSSRGDKHVPWRASFQRQIGGDSPRPGHRSFMESPVPARSAFPCLTGSAFRSRAQEHTSLAAPQPLPRVEAARGSGDPRRGSCCVHVRPSSTSLRLEPTRGLGTRRVLTSWEGGCPALRAQVYPEEPGPGGDTSAPVKRPAKTLDLIWLSFQAQCIPLT